MKHRMFLSTLGFAALAFTATPSHAASDPSGIWLNDVGSAKMEVKKCGKGICAKIVWLKDPNDSKGKPLHDVRNEVSSMHDRPILGMPLFSNMMPAGPSVWVGNVYNPEEGHVYTEVKITLASSKTIVLRGCKAWLLCGEKAWTRSKLDTKPEPETMPETPAQIEAKATPAPQAPSAAPQPMPVNAPEPKPQPKPVHEIQASAGGAPEMSDPLPVASVAAKPQALTPELPRGHDAHAGYGFVTTSATPEPAPLFSSQSPSSMFAMTSYSEDEAADAGIVEDSAAAAENAPMTLPAQKPEAKPKPNAPVANGTSAPVPVAAKPTPKPKPETTAEADTTVAVAPSVQAQA